MRLMCMVTIDHICVTYGEKVALSITKPIVLQEGDRIGIIGANGAGKSTLVKAILGVTPYKGRIITNLKQEEIAVHLQENNYVDNMPIRYIMEGILNTSIKKNKRLQELIAFFGMEDCLKKRYSALSGGQKQRMTIILVLLQDAKLTFFDEVTSGLDFETRQQLVLKLQEWYREKDTTICMVSHYYEELEQLVNKILILDQGQVVDYGTKEELFQKYCKHAIVILDNTAKNQEITKNYERIAAPSHLLALSCENEEKERQIINHLLAQNVNFKRSDRDIEIMSINALQGGIQHAE
ncbi:metal ABC transporter ATP-binding protein [Anaerosporobacter faecicola]|uniref:metal ABC transporter ATP-binding protein n=1 Tax=Anaerosporobacter faecicola TaxID=2718714 RepID=UPI001EE59622|nr:ABC transporter ATP-binding protein [Anaerosporobacter faecicola]